MIIFPVGLNATGAYESYLKTLETENDVNIQHTFLETFAGLTLNDMGPEKSTRYLGRGGFPPSYFHCLNVN